MRKPQLIIWIIFVVTFAGGCTLLPVSKPVEVKPDILLNQYITALKEKDLTVFSEQILSAGYSHTRQDGSVEDREAYLAKLTEIFQFSITNVQILAQNATFTATTCEIFLHWKMTLGYGFFNLKVIDIIDKTTLYYRKENGTWRLVEEAPVAKDADINYSLIVTEIIKDWQTFEELGVVEEVSLNTETVYAWGLWVFSEDQLNLTHQLKARWYSPDGELFYESPHFFTPTQLWWQYWCPMEIRGHVPPSLVGRWRVEVCLNDLWKYEKYFSVTP